VCRGTGSWAHNVGVTSGATSGGGAAARAAQSMAKHSNLLNGVKIKANKG